MTTYTQGVPTITDPGASAYLLRRTESRFVAGLVNALTLRLPVYRWNGTSWVRQN